MTSDLPQVPENNRRGLLAQTFGIVCAVLSGLIPVGGSVAFLLSPLNKKSGESKADDFLKITTLDSLPADGTVQQFPVMKDLVDAWNKFPNSPVGSIFLRKDETGKIIALNAKCPHLGCFIQYEAAQKGFECHCHGAGFKMNGDKVTENSEGKKVDNVSPRKMDELEVEIRNKNEVWVKYQNFRSGINEKIPTA